MTNFLNALKETTNYTHTLNGALTHRSTGSALYDLFAMGGAKRNADDEDILRLFHAAYMEDPKYALKCLFYLRDVRGGQGERNFFRVCMNYLANNETKARAKKMISWVPEYGRWDDLYCFVGTPLENEAFGFMKNQFDLDLVSKTPSLLAKWLKSENASSKETVELAKKTRMAFHMSPRDYRKALSKLRNRLRVVETLMSANRWDEIEFDKIPSKAGLIYRNAFARRDIIKDKYRDFASDVNTKVNAKTLYPYEVVEKAIHTSRYYGGDDTNRLMINKYWENLTDYFNDKSFNGLAVVDTSGSMWGQPINVAISLGMYCAERAKGPFKDHYISFASKPNLIKIEGVDFCDKVRNIYRTNLVDNTNIEAVFDLLLNTVQKANLTDKDMPEHIIIISDMEFDCARSNYFNRVEDNTSTLMETIAKNWYERTNVKMPKLIFWNVNARGENIPMKDAYGITFVSGFSPVIFEQIMTGKTSTDLMYDILNSERYAKIDY